MIMRQVLRTCAPFAASVSTDDVEAVANTNVYEALRQEKPGPRSTEKKINMWKVAQRGLSDAHSIRGAKTPTDPLVSTRRIAVALTFRIEATDRIPRVAIGFAPR